MIFNTPTTVCTLSFFHLLNLGFFLIMANKKKKAGPTKSQLKQEKLLADSQFVNERTFVALTAPLNHHVPFSSRGSLPQLHVDPSLSIHHVFVEDYSDNDDLDDEEVDFDSSYEDYIGTRAAPVASPVCATSPLVAPVEGTVPLDATLNVQRQTCLLTVDLLLLIEAELVSASEAATHNFGDWKLVRNKKAKCKPSLSKTSSRSPHVDFCLAQDNPYMVHRERQPTPPLPVAHHLSAPAPKVLAGHRTDKGKSVVSWTSGLRGYLPPPLLYVNSQLECQRTKLVSSKVTLMQQLQLNKWKVLSNAAVASTARIVVFWNPDMVHVDLFDFSAQGLHVLIYSLVHQFRFYASFVYGFNIVIARRTLWVDLRN
ncbi:hypothetical protein NC653_031934 [Populus alba x Populus x berolinensis]|uniref:Uncharacterized protein n=1 Tax=Populus alba x Populus x berolinensis TaxID=444605 RepID=A0AAD6LZZ8_9ROSI|nr:hypothetical protein NC653_031934 [Populus alba x Populus x berolinensis]